MSTSPSTPPEGEVLKRGRKRTVEREGERVVKRFHDPARPLGGWRDRLRARREVQRLARLERHGIPVPADAQQRRGPHGPEVVTAHVEGARSLEDALRQAEDGARTRRILERSAELLARLHARGILHGDLHPGNLVVDGDGNPVLVDAAAVRFGLLRPTPAARRERDLAQLGGSVREWLDASLRTRFLERYLEAFASLGGVGGAAWAQERHALRRKLERLSREARRASVKRHAGRWLRASSRCRWHASPIDGARVLAARALGDERVRELLLRLEPRGGTQGSLLLPDPHDASRDLDVALLPEREARARFRRAGRLLEHGVAAARPLILVPGSPATCVLSRPADWRALDRDRWVDGSPPQALRLGELAGTLFDRGLALGPGARPLVGASSAGLGCSAELLDARLDADVGEEPWLAAAATLDRQARRAFFLGFAHASREGAGHRATQLARLERS